VAWLQPGVITFEMFNESFRTGACQSGWCDSTCTTTCANLTITGISPYTRCMYECFIKFVGEAPSQAAAASILLPSCTRPGEAQGACSAGADSEHRSAWTYWDGFDQVVGAPSKPQLQTFVKLCAAVLQTTTVNGSYATLNGSYSTSPKNAQHRSLFQSCASVDPASCSRCSNSTNSSCQTLNYHSPEPLFPFLVQVPSSRGASGGGPKYVIANDAGSALGEQGAFAAPQPPLYFSARDADGHRMTQEVVLMLSTTIVFNNSFGVHSTNMSLTTVSRRAYNIRCFLADLDSAGPGPMPWPSRQCVAGRRAGFACFSNGDCPSMGMTETQLENCSETWSKCREYEDASSTHMSGNALKFDFDFASVDLTNLTGSSRTPLFTQHVVVTYDLPTSDAHSPSLPQGAPVLWRSSPGAAAPLLFSAFPCDPGTVNRPPVFVTGLLSTDTRVLSEYTCTFKEPCEIPLFARDFRPDEEVQSSDEISIKAAVGFEELNRRSLFKPDGSACRGSGALFCIFKLDAQASRPATAGAITRCFVTLDVHDAASSPGQRTCSSLPYCIQIRYNVFPSWRGYDPRIPVPKAQLKTSEAQHACGAYVYLDWAGEFLYGVNAGVSDAVKSDTVILQYSSAQSNGLKQHFYDIPTSYIKRVDTYEAFLSVEDLLRMSPCMSTQCEFAFRLAFRHSVAADSAAPCNGELFYGPVSNSVMAVPTTRRRPDKSLIAAEWHNHILRIWDVTAARRGEPALATVSHCHSVTPGTLTVDSTGNRLFAIIERVRDDAASLRPHLLTVDLTNGKQRQIALEVDVSFRNVEYDEAADVILAIQFSAQQADPSSTAFLVSLDPETGNKTFISSLQEPVRTSISAFSRRERIYYFISQRNGNIQRISLPIAVTKGAENEVGADTAERRPAQHLLPMALHAASCSQCKGLCSSCENNVVHAMSFSEDERALYALEGPWPYVDDGNVTLSSYDPAQGALIRRISTTITGRDIAYAVAAFHVNMSDIVIVTSQGRYSSYNLASNTIVHEEARDLRIVGKIVHVERLQNRSPLITAMLPPSVLTNTSTQITVAGLNFGMRDLSPSIRFLPLLGAPENPTGSYDVPCKETSWLSDNALACRLPDPSAFEWIPDFDALVLQGLPVEAEVRVGSSRSNAAFVNTQLPPSWLPSESELLSSVLAFPRKLTISGEKFHEPFASYRSIFSGDVHLAASGPPTSYNRTHLTFELPAWLASAGEANISLRRMSSSVHSSWPDTIVHPMGSAVTRVRFAEAWEVVSIQTMEALQVALITITGSGFDTAANESYECVLQTNPNEYIRHDTPLPPAPSNKVTIRAEIHSHRLAACHVRWPFAAGKACLWFVHNGMPVPRYASGNSVSPACAEFVFTQGWSSLSPTQSSIGKTILTYINGFGFNASAEYFCEFSPLDRSIMNYPNAGFATTVPATVMNVTTLSCAVGPSVGEAAFPTALVTLSYLSEQGDVAAVTKHGAPQHYEWLPAVSSLRPSSSYAQGGIPLSVFGFGLPAGLRYECTFADPHNPEAFSAVSAFWRSSGILECLVPQWNYPAGRIKVDVSRRDSATDAAGSEETETFEFEYVEMVLSAQHTAWSYAAASDVAVIFTGLGFNPDKAYTCVFAANQTDPVSSENAMTADMVSLITSVDAEASSSTGITCPLIAWPYFSGEVRVSLLQGAAAVAGPGSIHRHPTFPGIPFLLELFSSTFVIRERWMDADPRAVFASGASITIAGHGFAGVASDYLCEFAQAGRGENLSFAVRASNASLARIICNLPPGLGFRVQGTGFKV
jgi:hypothetical protein